MKRNTPKENVILAQSFVEVKPDRQNDRNGHNITKLTKEREEERERKDKASFDTAD